MKGRPSTQTLRVLISEPRSDRMSNPYITQLFNALDDQPGIEVLSASLRNLLWTPFDVFHVHWAEVLVRKRTALRSVVAVAVFGILLARIELMKKPVVRTVHNVNPHEELHPIHRWLIGRLFRSVVAEVHLTPTTVGHATSPQIEVIPHGDYRDWYAAFPKELAVRGRLACFGLLRPYKGVDTLIHAFRDIEDEGARLTIAGRANDERFAADLRRMAAEDPRISIETRFLEDDELVRMITEAELVILPYRYLVNSGASVLSLSLNRPILVPDGPAARELMAEVGPGWINTFDDTIESHDIERALVGTRSVIAGGSPSLEMRDWRTAGSRHADTYRAADRHRRSPKRARRWE
jgi:beta-1,4-mannosyltransferase